MSHWISSCLFYGSTTILSFLGIFYLYAKYKLSYWARRGVKTPPTHLICGNFKDTVTFKKPPGQVLQEIYDAAEPDDRYIGFYIFHRPALMLRDLELIKHILIKEFDTFPNRLFGSSNEKDSVGLINLLTIKQPRWKYLRSKLTPSLTGQKLKRMIPLMLECGNPMLAYIENTPENSDGWKKFELKDIASRYATDVISSLAFGITTNSFDKNDTAFWEAGQKVLSGLKRGIVLLLLFLVPEVAPIIEPFIVGPAKFFRYVFWDSMNTREKVGNVRGDLIDSFIALKNGEQISEYKFEGDNLLAQAVAFYVAGFEASSTAITFVLYELARHPDYESRLYEEIRNVIDKDGLTLESINEMTFLDRVVDETLRLYPPLPLIDRIAERDYKIPNSDLVLEKGMRIYVSTNGTNQDPRYFTDSQLFNPLREKNETPDIPGTLAFGIGPRSCVGQRIGLLITKIAVITVLLKYTFSYNADKENVLNPISIFTSAVDGVYLQLKKRLIK